MTTLSLENVVAIIGQLAGSIVWFGHAPLACIVADNGRRFDVERDGAGRIVKIEAAKRSAWAYL